MASLVLLTVAFACVTHVTGNTTTAVDYKLSCPAEDILRFEKPRQPSFYPGLTKSQHNSSAEDHGVLLKEPNRKDYETKSGNASLPQGLMQKIWNKLEMSRYSNNKRNEIVKRLRRSKANRTLLSLSVRGANVCPSRCSCQYGDVGTISVVECVNKSLLEIPKLPVSATEVFLQKNLIKVVNCTSLKYLKNLRKLYLSMNEIEALDNCSFSSLVSLEYLHLSGNRLTSLPVNVFKSLHQLVELDLSGNKINKLGLDLFLHLGQLSRLNIFNNKLTEVQNGTFQGLKSLVFLSLQKNNLRYVYGTFQKGAFLGLRSLESLHLEGNQRFFTTNFSYPDHAFELISTLKHLWLDGYPRLLGPGFSSLVNLTYLSFAGTEDSSCSMNSLIPPNFFHYLSTKQPLHLNMSSCLFSFIPPELFRDVKNLFSLDLSFNNHISIDDFETGSKGLENSSLTILNLTSIGHSWNYNRRIRNTTFQYLKHTRLEQLVFDDSKLIEVSPEAIADLPHTIQLLSFEGNKLLDASPLLTIIRFFNLTLVKISYQDHHRNDGVKRLTFQPLKNTYKEIDNLTHKRNRQDAFLQNRTIRTRRQINQQLFTNLQSHQYLNLSYILKDANLVGSNFCKQSENPTESLKNSSTDYFIVPLPRNVKQVYASDIKLSYNIPRVYFLNNEVLEYIDLSENGFNCLGGPISGLKSLQHLDISRNWCHRLNPMFFIHLGSVRTLLLYKNLFGYPLSEDDGWKTFHPLVKLEVLDLSNNVIEDLPKFLFTKNVNLKLLNLSHNELTRFGLILQHNRKLEKLDLSYNLLTGLSESNCRELLDIKETNPNFSVSIRGNRRFLCDCDHLFFLSFIFNYPEIFEDVDTFHCTLVNGSSASYSDLARILPQLGFQCLLQYIFIGVLIALFLVVGSLSGFALYHYKRWQWTYLYYMGKSRLHMGSMYLTYKPLADAYITYDQENCRLRTLMKTVFRPRLHEMDINTVLGEVDFGAGPREPSIAGAVTSTGKTVVFLSADIFQDYYRQFEVNLAIMHELHLRKPVVVPILLLRDEDLNCERSRLPNQESSTVTGNRGRTLVRRWNLITNKACSPKVDDFTKFKELIRKYPPEISTFLKGQIHRCLVYTGDSEMFWNHLRTIILGD